MLIYNCFNNKDCCYRIYPVAYQWSFLADVNETCDSFNNLCSFYTIVVQKSKQIIVVYRGTKTKRQLFVEGLESLQPGADFFGNGKVNFYF